MSVAAPVPSEAPLEAVPSFRERFLGVILRPRETLAGLEEPDAWFWPSLLLLMGYGTYYLAIGVGMGRFMTGFMTAIFRGPGGGNSASLPPNFLTIMGSMMPPLYIFLAVLQVPFYVALSWTLRTLVFYGFSVALGGARPRWSRVAAMVGWAWVPIFLQYVLLGVLMLAAPRIFTFFIPLPKDPMSAGSPAMANRQWQGSVAQILLEISPFVLWNMVLCMLGVEALFRLPRWKAFLVVFTPTLLQVLVQLAWIVLSLSLSRGMTPSPTAPMPVPNGPGP
jgi:hypothetical protein